MDLFPAVNFSPLAAGDTILLRFALDSRTLVARKETPMQSSRSHATRSPNRTDEILELQRQLGLSDSELASAIGVSARTLARWRSGIYLAPQGDTRDRLDNLL